MKKLGLWLFLLLSLLGCSKQEITVGVHPWIGYQPINLAQQASLLPKYLKLAENNTATETMNQLKQGTIDAGYLTLDEMLLLLEQGVDLSVVLVTDISSGADKVLANEAKLTPESLRHKIIGYEKGAVGELMLHAFLKSYGLKKSNVKTLEIAHQNQVKAWQDKQVDVMIAYDPVSTKIVRDNGYEVFSSRDMPQTIIDVLAVRDEVLENNCGAVNDLVNSHLNGLTLLKQNFQDSGYQVADNLGVSHQEVLQMLGGVTLPSKEINQQMLSGDFFAQKIVELSHVLVEAGMLSTPQTKKAYTNQCLY